jgi:hypothetical protein
MNPQPTAKQKQVLPALKAYLLLGKSITSLQALKRFGTMRLAEYIRVLRHEHGMKIEKKMVEENGKHFAEYWMPKRKKESRVVNRAYIHH